MVAGHHRPAVGLVGPAGRAAGRSSGRAGTAWSRRRRWRVASRGRSRRGRRSGGSAGGPVTGRPVRSAGPAAARRHHVRRRAPVASRSSADKLRAPGRPVRPSAARSGALPVRASVPARALSRPRVSASRETSRAAEVQPDRRRRPRGSRRAGAVPSSGASVRRRPRPPTTRSPPGAAGRSPSRCGECAETTRWSRAVQGVADERAELSGAELDEGAEARPRTWPRPAGGSAPAPAGGGRTGSRIASGSAGYGRDGRRRPDRQPSAGAARRSPPPP